LRQLAGRKTSGSKAYAVRGANDTSGRALISVRVQDAALKTVRDTSTQEDGKFETGEPDQEGDKCSVETRCSWVKRDEWKMFEW